MSYIGSKDEAWLLIERRLQETAAGHSQLACAEAQKGHNDLMEVYAAVALCCLEQLEKVKEMKKVDNYHVHYPHIDAVYGR